MKGEKDPKRLLSSAADELNLTNPELRGNFE